MLNLPGICSFWEKKTCPQRRKITGKEKDENISARGVKEKEEYLKKENIFSRGERHAGNFFGERNCGENRGLAVLGGIHGVVVIVQPILFLGVVLDWHLLMQSPFLLPFF